MMSTTTASTSRPAAVGSSARLPLSSVRGAVRAPLPRCRVVASAEKQQGGWLSFFFGSPKPELAPQKALPPPSAKSTEELLQETDELRARLNSAKAVIAEVTPSTDDEVDVRQSLEAALNLSSQAPLSEAEYMTQRVETIQSHFETAIPVDDFVFRLEMALNAFGFDGDNTISVVNLCRDEITNVLRAKLEEVYPIMFNINGLGGGLTCGVTGMKAGLSHAPKCAASGKERYLFFSCPHIAIDAQGNIGAVGRIGQQKTSCACGALIASLSTFKAEGIEGHVVTPGVHTPMDPEFSILKQRLARRIVQEDLDVQKMDLVDITKVAERQIGADLELLVKSAVPEGADYAIISGVQIHNWADTFDNDEPNLEFVAPYKVSVVIDGKRQELDLLNMPALTPRQVRLLSGNNASESTASSVAYTGKVTVATLSGNGIFATEKTSDLNKAKARESTISNLRQ